MIARMPERPVVLEMQHITKRFPGIVANDDVELRPPRGRGPRPPRRERRRQVDADEHPLRALPPGPGRDPHQGQARPARLTARCDRRGRRDGAPALHADPGDDGRGEHRARLGAGARRRAARPAGRRAACRRAVGALLARGRPPLAHRGHHRRAAAASRDPEGAVPQRGHPRRSTSRRQCSPRRRRGSCSRSCAASPRRGSPSSSSATS